MNIIDIEKPGQVQEGDLLLLQKSNGITFPAIVKHVCSPGTDGEEIVINNRRNLYFNVSMYIDGKSWIKSCKKIIDGKMYSVTNNMNAWV